MTLPVPSGVFMPIFVLGAAIGRLAGEVMFCLARVFVSSEPEGAALLYHLRLFAIEYAEHPTMDDCRL